MILGTATRPMLGDVEVTVDPIVLVNPATGDKVQGPPGYVVEGRVAQGRDWTWIILAAALGLAVGWWLSGEGAGRSSVGPI